MCVGGGWATTSTAEAKAHGRRRFGKKPTLTDRSCWRGCGCGLLNDRICWSASSQGWLETACCGPSKTSWESALWDAGETHWEVTFWFFACCWENMLVHECLCAAWVSYVAFCQELQEQPHLTTPTLHLHTRTQKSSSCLQQCHCLALCWQRLTLH